MNKLNLLIITMLGLLLASCQSHRSNTRAQVQYQQRLQELDRAIEAEIASEAATRLIAEAQTWLGTPYKYGGHTKRGTDCSGFIMAVYESALGIKLPRSAHDQSEYCQRIELHELQPGDMVFFMANKNKKGKVAHVGMYMGDGRMIHASSSRGVRIDDIGSEYYVQRYTHSGRVTYK